MILFILLLGILLSTPLCAREMTYEQYLITKRQIVNAMNMRDQHYLESHKLSDEERDAHWRCLASAHLKEENGRFATLDEYQTAVNKCFPQ